MDKPVKVNTVPVVLDRLTELCKELGSITEVYPEHAGLPRQVFAGLNGFFGVYNIACPTPNPGQPNQELDAGDAKTGLGQILLRHGQVALDAVEGVARLARKVALVTYEQGNPAHYINSLLETLKGLPLEQLRSTPDKQSVASDNRTVRDRVSDLITIGRSTQPYMLQLLGGILPEAVNEVRKHGPEVQLEAIGKVLAYVNRASNSVLAGADPYSIETVEGQIKKILAGAGGFRQNGHDALTQASLLDICKRPDPRTGLEKMFGGRVVAVDFTSGHDGARRQVEIYVTKGQGAEKHSVHFGTSTAPGHVVDALIRMAEECRVPLAPSDPFYGLNQHGINTLPHLARR